MEELENQIITVNQSNQLDTTDDILAAANRRIAQLDKIVKLSISRTNQNDWVDQDNKPYLTCSGAEKSPVCLVFVGKTLKQKRLLRQTNKVNTTFTRCRGLLFWVQTISARLGHALKKTNSLRSVAAK